MVEYVHPDVAALSDQATADATANLVIVPKENRFDEVVEAVQDIGGSIEERLPLGMFEAAVPQAEIEELTNRSEIKSIQFDDELEVLSSGNAYPKA